MSVVSIPPKRKQGFLPKGYCLTVWSRLKPYFNELLERSIDSIEELNQWIIDRNEIESFVHEEINWRYLRFAQDSRNVDAKEAYAYAVQAIESKLGPINHQLDEKLLASPFTIHLPKNTFDVYLENIKRQRTIFCEANQVLQSKIELQSRTYTEIFSKISILVKDQELTVQEANALLEGDNRKLREEVFRKLAKNILDEKPKLQELFSELLTARHQMALNAGFENFRNYQFQVLNRTDYGVKECRNFQESVLQEIVPLVKRFNQYRKKNLGLNQLKPWDVQGDIKNRKALQPFQGLDDLLERTNKTLAAISPFFAECFTTLQEKEHLDVGARKHKRPGGFLMAMPKTRVPFIFSNATHSIKDVRSLLHESGHAIHTFFMEDIAHCELRRVPAEVAELASMTMELMGMEHWEFFFEEKEQLLQAKSWQLLRVLEILPWIAAIDRFQHWLYTHPQHSIAEREEKWDTIHQDFCLPEVDWSGLENYRKVSWLNQLHMFESPFYFIEYGFAQLGAIALWQQYQDDPKQMLHQFTSALKLGNTRKVTEIYKTAGISFDWSADYLKKIGSRVLRELEDVLGRTL